MKKRGEHEETRRELRELLAQTVLNPNSPDVSQFLPVRGIHDIGILHGELYNSIDAWAWRFSQTVDTRAHRFLRDIVDGDTIIDRLYAATLDGTSLDKRLLDETLRGYFFTSVVSTMIWEFIFARYLFGLDPEQRKRLQLVEKSLSSGPSKVLREWRATTLRILSTETGYQERCSMDAEAVTSFILRTVSAIIPAPNVVSGDQGSGLRKIVNCAVDLSILMRVQRADYMVFPPAQVRYDEDGNISDFLTFNTGLMNLQGYSGPLSPEELEKRKARVAISMYPVVVAEGDEDGDGDDERVAFPSQVLLADPV